MAKAEVPLMEELKGQWTSMFGMAGMFTITIYLATLIQPFYDRDEFRAFGPGSETKAGFILIEGVFILIFTFTIIWLAKKNMQKFIQFGILFVLWIALSYSLVPMAHLALPADELTATTTETDSGAHILQGLSDVEHLILYDGNNLISVEEAIGGDGAYAGGTVNWSTNVSNLHGEIPSPNPFFTPSTNDFVMCDSTQWIRIDSNDGTILERFDDDCNLGFVDSGGLPWHIVRSSLMKIDPFKPIEEVNSSRNSGWEWLMPMGFDPNNILTSEHIGENHMLIVSSRWAGVFEIPNDSHGEGFNAPYIETVWNYSLPEGNMFTAATYGSDTNEIKNETANEFSLYLGRIDGVVNGFRVHSNGTVVANDAVSFEEEFEGPIRGLLLEDCCNGGVNDLWVLDGEDLRVFMGSSKIDRTRTTTIAGDEMVDMAIQYRSHSDYNIMKEGVILFDTNSSSIDEPLKMVVWSLSEAAPFEVAGIGVSWADLIAFVFSIVLMGAIILWPEWYVVNTTGILVGAGVSVMLGISFVPWIVIIFMIAMAFYDHWAVNGSKHMLTLADTMIDLKLPILLVAPKDKEYSFLNADEGTMVERDRKSQISKESIETSDLTFKPEKEPKKTSDAMFMGLGDVIFPGILVISAMSWLPNEIGFAGLHGPTTVAFGTLIGGLIGYMILMTQVARGKPQAGLPLLNGGSILGYLLTTIVILGFDALAFNITLF